MAQLVKESTCNVGDLGSIPGLGRSPGKGKSYSPQYSGLQNIVHGVDKELDMTERLSHFTHSRTSYIVFYPQSRKTNGTHISESQKPRRPRPLPFFFFHLLCCLSAVCWLADPFSARPWIQKVGSLGIIFPRVWSQQISHFRFWKCHIQARRQAEGRQRPYSSQQ